MRHPTRFQLLCFLGLFFVSGACGLVYEIVWTRMLGLTLGHTVYSMSTVLVAFMGGLALGSWVGGRIADRSANPLRLYGLLEGGIAMACLAVPALIAATQPLFAWFYRSLWDSFLGFTLLRFAVCALILLVPTTLMGATLPVLTRYFVRAPDTFGATLGKLYAFNTLGAAAGACVTGFWLIPALGQTWSIVAAAAGNLAVCAVAVGLSRTPVPVPVPADAAPAEPGDHASASRVSLALGASGVASMVYQVAWTRVLALNIGSSTYAFTIIVTAFILGLGLGSLLLVRIVDRSRRLGAVFAATQVLIAAAALAMVPLFGALPNWLRHLLASQAEAFQRSFALLHLVEFGIVFGLFLVPTLLMGATFPIAAKLVTRDLRAVGRTVGRVYACNTMGAILGSFLGGFVFLPLFGLQRSIEIAAAVNLAAAAMVLRGRTALACAALATAAALVPVCGGHLLPEWDRKVLDSGVYRYAIKQVGGDRGGDAPGDSDDSTGGGHGYYRLVSFQEGASATVSVYRRDASAVALRINGKTDASTTGDLPTQLLVGHIPMLVAPSVDRVLVIGLGSGLTLGAMSRYPAKSLDYVELCPEVDRAAREHFASFCWRVFDDPRVRGIVNDGRNHVALTDRRYDVISSQPTNLWIAGVGSLFTREYFLQCRDRLSAEGVLCQWVQAYTLSPEDFRCVVATFLGVFPKATLWEPKPGADYALVGFKGPLAFDLDRAAARFARDEVREDLRRVCVHRWEDVLGYLIMGPEQLEALARGAAPDTDDRARLEFSTPRSIYQSTRQLQLEMIREHRVDPTPILLADVTEGERRRALEAELRRIHRAHTLSTQGLRAWEDTKFPTAQELFEQAWEVNPRDPIASWRLAQLYLVLGQHQVQGGNAAGALRLFEKALANHPTSWELESKIAFAHLAGGHWAEAKEHLERARASASDAYEVLVNLGVVELNLGGPEKALDYFEAAMKAQPDLDPAWIHAARLYRKTGRLLDAEKAYLRAIELRPDTAVLHQELAGVYSSMSPADPDRARVHLGRAQELGGK